MNCLPLNSKKQISYFGSQEWRDSRTNRYCSFSDQPSYVSILGSIRVLWWYSQDGKEERNYGKPYRVETDKNDHSAITFVKFSGFVIRDAEELVHIDYKEIWEKLREKDQRK